MDTITTGSDCLAAEFNQLPQATGENRFDATIANSDHQPVCPGKVDLYLTKSSSELSRGTFWPNNWPVHMDLDTPKILKIKGKRDFEIMCLEQCFSGGTHYHFRFETSALE